MIEKTQTPTLVKSQVNSTFCRAMHKDHTQHFYRRHYDQTVLEKERLENYRRLPQARKEEISSEFNRALEKHFRQFNEEFQLDFEWKVEKGRLSRRGSLRQEFRNLFLRP